jgi:hypothetical protein
MPLGEFGPFCPTTLLQERWLLPGKNEFEAYYRGRKHKFYSEKDQTYFKENISEFYGQERKKIEVKIFFYFFT